MKHKKIIITILLVYIQHTISICQNAKLVIEGDINKEDFGVLINYYCIEKKQEIVIKCENNLTYNKTDILKIIFENYENNSLRFWTEIMGCDRFHVLSDGYQMTYTLLDNTYCLSGKYKLEIDSDNLEKEYYKENRIILFLKNQKKEIIEYTQKLIDCNNPAYNDEIEKMKEQIEQLDKFLEAGGNYEFKSEYEVENYFFYLKDKDITYRFIRLDHSKWLLNISMPMNLDLSVIDGFIDCNESN